MLQSSPPPRLVVLKLGGSLLSCPDVSVRLRRLLAELASNRVLIIVGGGTSADVVRDWSRIYDLSEEDAHWIALRSLSVTRALVKGLLPELGEVASHAEALRWWPETGTAVLLDVESCLRQAEASDAAPLPHAWSVTSDSIAAWVAARWSADELILLKSTDLSSGITLEQGCRDGLVDPYFSEAAVEVRQTSWCNLLDDRLRIQPWLSCASGDFEKRTDR